MSVPTVDPTWLAARNGLPADLTAVDHASQVDQFLTTHSIAVAYQGTQILVPVASGATSGGAFSWLAPGDTGWLGVYDVDQPFVMPAGKTTIGRVEIPALPVGAGKDLSVTLYPDNAGAPNLTAPIVSTIIPAAQIEAMAATGSLAAAGPLQTAQFNTALPGQATTYPWTLGAGSVHGAPNYASSVTSGNWTVFIGGYDSSTQAPIAAVSSVQYLGNGQVSSAIPQQPLPEGLANAAVGVTADTIVAGGGQSTTLAQTADVWTASWDPVTGTVGAWTNQTALPTVNFGLAMAGGASTVYIAGGSTTGNPAASTNAVYWATVTNGQITAWNPGPALPQALYFPFMAVIGDWLIVAGGFEINGSTHSTATYYAPIYADGSLGGWQVGPNLPQAGIPVGQGLNQAQTDSALIIALANIPSPTDAVWVLAVGPDGPGTEWQWVNWGAGTFLGPQVGAYPAGLAGQWDLVVFEITQYVSGPLYPVPIISVPLPATGLTPGNTYHLVFRESD